MRKTDYLPRIVDAQIRRLLSVSPILTIEGGRATGKTTSAQRFCASEIRLPRDLELLRSDPEALLGRLSRPVLIDEWQLAGTDLLWTLKALVDEDPTPGQFVLTGSVEPESYGTTYPLTGRGVRVEMRPMNQRELEGRGGESLWLNRLQAGEFYQPTKGDGKPIGYERLIHSGFPIAAQSSAPSEWLRAYAASIAERSIEERRDPTRVSRVMRVLAELEAATVPDERIWQDSDINRETFRSYERMLERTHTIVPSPAWQTNRLKRITTYPKRYFADPGLSLALAGISVELLQADPGLAGQFFDSFVAAQLRPELDAVGGTLHHLRTKAGKREVDILMEINGQILAVEVKHGTRPTRDDAKHLAWLREELGDRVAAAVLIHRGVDTMELTEGVWALPISMLWQADEGADSQESE